MVSRTEAVRGTERIQQLMEEFPEIPRNLVVKEDMLREGIKPTETTRQIGRWALPDAPWYFEYNKEAAHRAQQRAGGYLLSPLCGYFRDWVSFQLLFDSRSPYEVRYEERGRYWLYRDEEPIEEVFFPPRPEWYDRRTSSGKPMPAVITQRGEGHLWVSALNYCEYFKDGNGCRYCNINASESTNRELGLERLTAKREEDLYETMVAACRESKQNSMGMSGGVMLDPSKEADMYARIAKVLRRAEKDAGYEIAVGRVVSQALELGDTIKLKEAGLTNIRFNTEVWEPRLFEIICPGKAKYVGRDRWLERLTQAVEVFGEGSVGTTFIIGMEMAPPYGFKTEDEGAASYLEGYKWMLDHGVMPGGGPWRPVAGTIFEGMEPPRTEYLLRIELARHKILVERSKARKPARLSGEAGLSIAGDIPYFGLVNAAAAGSPQDVC